jgi:hypothetical protein
LRKKVRIFYNGQAVHLLTKNKKPPPAKAKVKKENIGLFGTADEHDANNHKHDGNEHKT